MLLVVNAVCTRALLEATWSVLGELLLEPLLENFFPGHSHGSCFSSFFVICSSLKA